MSTLNDYPGFVDGLRLTMFVGAANEAVPDENRAEFADRVRALLPDWERTGDPAAFKALAAEYLGPGWAPSGGWASVAGKL